MYITSLVIHSLEGEGEDTHTYTHTHTHTNMHTDIAYRHSWTEAILRN